MKVIKIILPILLLISLISCEKEIELDEQLIKSRIVVNSIFSANDTVKVHLSESRNILYNNGAPLPNIENAEVTLWHNNSLFGTLTHIENGVYTLNNPKPIAGESYTLKVKHSKLDDVNASSVCPSLTTIINMDTNTVLDKFKMELSIQDNASQKNYYAIKSISRYVYTYETSPGVVQTDTTIYSEYICTKDNNAETESDQDGEQCNQELLYSDSNFNGDNYVFRIEQYKSIELDHITIIVESISADLFKYKRTLQLYKENQGNPFGEPVQVYSNIENGLGIFSGYSVTKKEIQF